MKDDILSQVFSARIKATEALLQAEGAQSNEPHLLRQIAANIEIDSSLYASPYVATIYAAFADLLRICASLVEWRAAVLEAQTEADRFLRGAKERYQLWTNEYRERLSDSALLAKSERILQCDSLQDVGLICKDLAVTPMPISALGNAYPSIPRTSNQEEKPEPPPELAVAFLKFLINSEVVSEVHHLSPNEVHDLEIEVRVSRWPLAANQLCLAPVSIEPASTYDLPTFTFDRPQEEPPYTLHGRGRAVLKVSQSIQARPFEFKYMAEFLPNEVEQPVAVTGYRTLLIESLDLARAPLTGYQNLDKAIIDIRNQLRTQTFTTADEVRGLLDVLTTLCNLAGRAVQDSIFVGDWDEARFQEYIRDELRRNPKIGRHLDEHAHAAGGITDLSLDGMPIELKVERKKNLSLKDCEKYVDQTISYTVAKSKRIGVLCVLDSGTKTKPAHAPEEFLECYFKHGEKGKLAVCVLIIQGNLPLPSSHSR